VHAVALLRQHGEFRAAGGEERGVVPPVALAPQGEPAQRLGVGGDGGAQDDGGLEELQPVAERVVRVDAAETREVAVPGDLLAGRPEPLDQPVEVGDQDAGVALAGGAEVVLDTQVQLQATGGEPRATPRGEHRWLGDLGHPQDAHEEGPGGLLLAGRHGQLGVVQPLEHGRDCAVSVGGGREPLPLSPASVPCAAPGA
jgi:hypothetical protein